jgi:hypothetical protein
VKAISIRDSNPEGILAFDLIHILRLAGSDALVSTWRCANVECVGPAAEKLHSASDGCALSGTELVAIADQVDQVTDGDFFAHRDPASSPWLVIRAIDSSEYVVITRDDELVFRIREAFHDVRDSPDDVPFVKP